MSILKSNNSNSEHKLTQIDENKKLASLGLKRADQFIKSKEYQNALKEIGRVKEVDPKNVYAIALEERIQTLIEEEYKKQQEKIQLEKEEQFVKPVDDTTKKGIHSTPPQQLQTNVKYEQATPKSLTIQNSNDIWLNYTKPLDNAVQSNKETKRKPKVIIIDDDENLLSVLSSSIEAGGFEAIPLCTSDEAYVLLRKLTPDLILCDINLETSTMGGFTFYEKIRQMENIKNVPFIFLSGLTDDVLIRTGKEMGVDDYLTKPIKEQNLLSAIRGKIKRYEELGLRPGANLQNTLNTTAYSHI